MTIHNETGQRGSGRGERSRNGGRRLPRRAVHVLNKVALSDNLVRIVVGAELRDWDTIGAGGHFKIFLPLADGETATRTYTVREYDAERAELTIDFALHAAGPASDFARNAAPGDKFEVSGGSRPGFTPQPGSEWTLLIADQSALPAAAAILERLPEHHEARVVVEVPGESDVLALASRAALATSWVVESGESNARLVEAALGLKVPAGHGEVWVGCESSAMRAIRRHLLGELALERDDVHTRGYWKQGVVAHTDHDTGEDSEGTR